MTRTQIYLSDEITVELDRLAEETGRSRSQLIREAIGNQYLRGVNPESLVSVLRETAGAWRGKRARGAAAVERVRGGRLARLHTARRG